MNKTILLTAALMAGTTVAASAETLRWARAGDSLTPDPHAQNEPTISALERLMGVEEHELTIAQTLEPIYQATGDWQKQITVFQIMAKHASLSDSNLYDLLGITITGGQVEPQLRVVVDGTGDRVQ